MDQIKIGKFIAELRKKENLTQFELAEKLGITDRAVSKWERGLALPDAAVMIELCKILKITVNDLLKGEIIMENKNENQEIILDLVKQKQEADKMLLRLEIVVGITCVIIMLALCMIAGFVQMADWLRIVLILVGLLPLLVAMPFLIKIEQKAGYYVCGNCKHKYIPSYSSVFMAMHYGRTRYMKCPKCGKWTWQKKVIDKE